MDVDTIKSRTPQEIAKLNSLLNGLHDETDRGACLIACSYLNEILEGIIKAFLINDSDYKALFSGPAAPLSSLWTKSIMAFSLGLIDKIEFDEIGTIRKIRNEFAHSWEDINFNDNKLTKKVLTLPWRGPKGDNQSNNAREKL